MGQGGKGEAATVRAGGGEQLLPRRIKLTLPALRTQSIAEPGAVVALAQAVMTAFLFRSPTGGQIVGAVDKVVNHRVVVAARAKDLIAAFAQIFDEIA